jgi:hypothetical protein
VANIFDNMRDSLFDLTTQTFGYDASWTPVGGESPTQTGRVHFRRPTEKDVLTNGVEYMPFVFFMEYKEGVFTGLLDSVRNGVLETVTVNGINHYVRSVGRAYDGETLQAHLERII